MRKKNATMQALFTSVLSLLLCVSMLVGTTFAWFTDSVDSGMNTIAAGNLDIELLADGEKVDTNTKLFADVKLWEPGVVVYENLQIANVGTLALKYQMSLNFGGENNLNGNKLSDVLQVAIIDKIDTNATRQEVLAAVEDAKNVGTLQNFNLAGALEAGESTAEQTVVIFWEPGENDNWYNANNGQKTSDGKPLYIEFGVNLIATQQMSEEDSFGPDYDGATPWVTVENNDWFFSAIAEDPDETEFTISSAEDLAGLMALVNGTATAPVTTFAVGSENVVQESFAGKTITLSSDIDLAGHVWTPIGNWDNAFEGTFDGQGHTISNLYVNAPEGEGVGLFGVVANAEIKNVTVNNVNVTGYSMVSAIAGAAYPAVISNCHVTGSIKLVSEWAYVGGIAGYCYYGTQVDKCSTVATNGMGLIKSETRNAVGGITAWLLEGDHKVTNCEVKNLDLVGWTNVGAITGFVHYSNTINGCSVENVNLTKTREGGNPGIGLIAGGYSYSASKAITLSNNTVKNATLNGNHIAYSTYNELYGSEYGGSLNANFTLTNNTTENVTNNLVEVAVIKDAASLKAALANGGSNYILTQDVVVANNETITIANGTSVVIDLNGYKISGTADKSGNEELFLVKGDLTLKNGSLDYSTTNNQGWNAMITIFDVTAGGELTLEEVTASVAGSDMNFIVHLNNWGSATLNVNNCDFTAPYVAVRAFNSGKDMNNVTIKNTAFHGGRMFWVHNYTAEGKGDATLNLDIYGNRNTTDNAKPVRFGFNNELYFNIDGVQLVTATTLPEVMAAAKNGNVIIDAQGANLGDFSYDGTFGNGTVLKNAKFTYVYGASVDGVATFENCEFVSDHSYSANFSDGSYTGKVIFNNCYFDGWNSFGTTITSVEMNNCTFETVIGPYSLLRFYQNAVLNNCVIKDSFDGIDTNMTGTVIELNNCTGIEGKIYNNTDGGVVKVGTWIVDGVELTDVPAW